MDENEQKLMQNLYEQRPKTRGDCKYGLRPCPWISCKYHLAIEGVRANGEPKYNKLLDIESKTNPEDIELNLYLLPETCALDIADKGGCILEDVGELLGISRERIRQIEVHAVNALQEVTPYNRIHDILETLEEQQKGHLPQDIADDYYGTSKGKISNYKTIIPPSSSALPHKHYTDTEAKRFEKIYSQPKKSSNRYREGAPTKMSSAKHKRSALEELPQLARELLQKSIDSNGRNPTPVVVCKMLDEWSYKYPSKEAVRMYIKRRCSNYQSSRMKSVKPKIKKEEKTRDIEPPTPMLEIEAMKAMPATPVALSILMAVWPEIIPNNDYEKVLNLLKALPLLAVSPH